MEFNTKVWKRSEKSYATTIPQALLFLLDLSKKYHVNWKYSKEKWYVDFNEKKSTEERTFSTTLWKRSQRSYGTTIPHVVLLHMDEEKEQEIVWSYDNKFKKWVVELIEVRL